jgi:ribosomal protein L7/L12
MSETVLLGVLVGAGMALLLVRLMAIERRLDRLSRLEAKVDALLKHAGVEFDAFSDVPLDVKEALERGETILAIKRFRQATGVGLKDAKDVIDELRRRSASLS